jgi:zinc transport system substrate-binding protein
MNRYTAFPTVLVCIVAILFYTIIITTITILPPQLNFLTADSSAFITPTKTMTNNNNNNNTSSSDPSNLRKVKVVASFYPIYDFAKHVGGDRIDASVLIPIGAEPHDFDPTIQQILAAQSADMMVYNGAGMENAWIKKIKLRFAVDTSQGLQQLLTSNESSDQRGLDPHIWLDPILAIHQVEIIRDGLIKIDPNNANYYNQNAEKFIGQLRALDASIRSQLSSSNCAKRDFIAFHQAFSYFAKRYGLNQHSIQGLSPEGEILSQRLVQVVQLSDDLGINVIYSEDLIDPRSSQAIAQEIPNGKVMVLSPVEGIKPQEQRASIGYLDKMNENVAALKVGLQCKK